MVKKFITFRSICFSRDILAMATAYLILASAALAQEQSHLDRLEAMELETIVTGRVTTYYAPDDRERAAELAMLVEEAAALLERELGVSFDFRVAVLSSAHWFSEFPDGPYTIPWCDVAKRVIFLPPSDEKLPPRAFSRAIDFIALHEYGHLASKQYFHPTGNREYGPVRWFEEFLATYFGYAFVQTFHPQWAERIAREWKDNLENYTPRVLSLDWRFMRDLSPDELGRTYGWYQNMLNLRVADVYDQYGIAFLRALKEDLPWHDLDTWTTASLLPGLEDIAPGFEAWSESLETHHRD
jgi:hypothetical protein